jgi:hypothetical protein
MHYKPFKSRRYEGENTESKHRDGEQTEGMVNTEMREGKTQRDPGDGKHRDGESNRGMVNTD